MKTEDPRNTFPVFTDNDNDNNNDDDDDDDNDDDDDDDESYKWNKEFILFDILFHITETIHIYSFFCFIVN